MEHLLIVLTEEEIEALKLKDESCSDLVKASGNHSSSSRGLDNLVPPIIKS